MVRVHFLKQVDDFKPGDVCVIERTLASRLISSGHVESYSDYVEKMSELAATKKLKKKVKKRTKRKGLEKATRNN